jgi:hypothetical protein
VKYTIATDTWDSIYYINILKENRGYCGSNKLHVDIIILFEEWIIRKWKFIDCHISKINKFKKRIMIGINKSQSTMNKVYI